MNLKKIFITLIFIPYILNSLQSKAQSSYSVKDIPSTLLRNASLVIRNEYQSAEMLSNNEVKLHVNKAYTVLNEKDKNMATLILGYYKDLKISNCKGEIYDADGHLLKKIGLKDFKDESAVSNFSLYEDDRIKYYEPSSIKYPITVVYDYTLIYGQNLIIPDWIPQYRRSVSVQESKYEFICKPEDSLMIKERNFSGKHETNILNGRKKTAWVVNNIPAQEEEPIAPPFKDSRILVKIAPVQFSYYKYNGRYHNWSELGRWFYNTLLKERQVPTAKMEALVHQIQASSSDTSYIVKMLYQYLQKNFRYVSIQIGIGGFRPMSAAEVDAKGYGDCKALVNYMQTLLNIAHIPSYYCVVEAGSQKESLFADYASMDQGNHVILLVPTAKDSIWLECTDQNIPAGFLGYFTDDRTVWASNADSSFTITTPSYASNTNRQLQVADLKMDDDGNLKGIFNASFSGNQFENHLSLINLSQNECEKKLIGWYNIDNMQVRNIKVNIEQNKYQSPILNESFDIELPHNIAKSNNLYYFKPNLFNGVNVPPIIRNRQQPVYFSRGYLDEDSLIIQLPNGIHMNSSILDKNLSSTFGTYRIQIKEENGKLLYYRKIFRVEGQFPAEEYEKYKDFMSNINALDNSKIILVRQ